VLREKNLYSILYVLIALLFCASLLHAEFAGGSGTYADPWLIETAEHLDMVREYVGSNHSDKYFKQIADIDLGVAPWNEDSGWLPIGNRDKKFSGNYNGDGHTVSGLYIRRSYLDNVGLFGFCMDAGIKNLNVKDVDIVGMKWVGGLVGDFSATDGDMPAKLENCSASGVVKGTSRVGGLAGYIVRSHVIASSARTKVISVDEAEAFSGGLVGFGSTDSRIVDCYARGDIENRDQAKYSGGLIGAVENGHSSYCFSTGKVTGGVDIGGLVGVTNSDVGRYSYWDMDTSGLSYSKGGDGRTTEQMIFPHRSNSFLGWDFDNIWTLDINHQANDGYPYHGVIKEVPYVAVKPSPENEEKGVEIDVTLSWEAELNEEFTNSPSGFMLSFGTDDPPTNIIDELDLKMMLEYKIEAVLEVETTYYWQVKPYNKKGTAEESPVWSFETYYPGEHHFSGGSGDEEDPWIIETTDHLHNIKKYLNIEKYFLQIADIDLGANEVDRVDNWDAIGISYSNSFKGVYDGGNHTISNMKVEKSDLNYQGLFGYVASGTVKNVNLINAEVSGKDQAGALIGTMLEEAMVINCHAQGVVSGKNSIGGLIGRAHNSEIYYSSSYVEVDGQSTVGGLIADNQSSRVSNSYSRGSVKGVDRVGGLIGNNYMSSIIHSYAASVVSGQMNLGGFIGRISPYDEIDENNYWDIDVSGLDESSGGSGKHTEEMIYPFGEEVYEGWDFENIWTFDRELVINDGYPYHLSEINVSAEKVAVIQPNSISLRNYPNPFNPETTISFDLFESGEVSLTLYNIKGQEIKSLVNKQLNPGNHKVTWDGKDDNGKELSSGIYFYKLTTHQGVVTNKMMLLK